MNLILPLRPSSPLPPPPTPFPPVRRNGFLRQVRILRFNPFLLRVDMQVPRLLGTLFRDTRPLAFVHFRICAIREMK